MSSIRTFVAVDISAAVRNRAAELEQRLGQSGADVRWVDPDNLHLTLKFLGDVPDVEVPAVCQAVTSACRGRAPFSFTCAGLGAFPRIDRPRTLWLGVEQSDQGLLPLQVDVERALKKLGYPLERRPYHPHLTLGRLRRGGAAVGPLSDLLRQNADCRAGTVLVDEVLVYASFLDRTGPTYNVMGRTRLVEEGTVTGGD